MKKLMLVSQLLVSILFVSNSNIFAGDCTGCCSGHGGVVCAGSYTRCADGTSLSSTCISKGCSACSYIPPQCTYQISPDSKSFTFSSESGSVSVSASSSSCVWSASSNNSWITISSGNGYTGSGNVGYSVSSNTDINSRTGTLTIAGKTFTITQNGKIPDPVATADWTGIWVSASSGNEYSISQNGLQINAVHTKPSASSVTQYGWKAGDQSFYGTLNGQTMSGKLYVHYPVSYQTSCPTQWIASYDLILTMSSDGNTISGQYTGGVIQSNCSVAMNTSPTTFTYTRKAQCFHVNDDLKIAVTCAEYQGVKYKFNLNYISYLFWKMDTDTVANGDVGNCISVGNDLKLNMSCAELKGNVYGFTMNFIPKTDDPSGIYWELDTNTFKQK